MESRSITLVKLDGRSIEHTTQTFGIPADRIAVERTYQVPMSDLGGGHSKEEWALFLVYRVAQREIEEFKGATFDAFVEGLSSYEFNDDKAEPAADPTVEKALTG